MTGEMMWQAYCRATNTDRDRRHDMWKFCGGGAFSDELANLVLTGVKTATASTKLAYEMEDESLPDVGTYSVILFDNDEAACLFITLSVFAYFIEKLDNVVLQVGILMIVIFAEIAQVQFEHNVMKKKMVKKKKQT